MYVKDEYNIIKISRNEIYIKNLNFVSFLSIGLFIVLEKNNKMWNHTFILEIII